MFNEFEDIDAAIFFRDVKCQHLDGVLAEERPASDVRQLQGVSLQVDVRNPGPLVRLQALHLKPRRELRDTVFPGIEQHC